MIFFQGTLEFRNFTFEPMGTRLVLFLALLAISLYGLAQVNETYKINCSIGTDVVSSYIWRAMPQGNAPAIQPYGELSYKGLAVGTWGSYEFKGDFNEIDLYAKYTLSSFSLLFTDLFFPGYPGLDQNYFNFNNATTGHAAELGLSFNGTEKIPLSVYAGIILYGTAIDPETDNPNKLNRSVYLECNYWGQIKDVSCNIFAGLTPGSSALYQTNGFSLFNIGVSAKKSVKITDSFSVPVKLTLATHTANKKLLLAVAISL
jgi:hypothetical protein